MTLKKITFINIPLNAAIAVFGMDDEQWTVNSSEALTYFNGKSNEDNLIISGFIPAKPKILIRVISIEYTWRTDKMYRNPITGTYSPELILMTNQYDEYTFDGDEFLEPDEFMVERPKRDPIIKIKDKSDYTLSKNIINPETTTNVKPKDFKLSDIESKSILTILTSIDHVKIEDFRHALPRAIMNLLHIPIPIGNNHYRLAFFHMDFLNLNDISETERERKPWYYKAENAQLLFKAKIEFISLIKDNIVQISCLSTRELKNYGYIQEELPLRLPDIHSNDKRPLWRYLTLPKFIDLISSSKLWFAKPSTFSDPFESKTNRRTRADQIWKMMNRVLDDYNIAVYENDSAYLDNQKWVVLDLEKDKKGLVKSIEYQMFSDAPENLKIFAEYKLNKLLDAQLVNSWHINENESEGMWNLYSDSEYGVAIISNQELIRNSFRTPFGSPKILQIQYHDLHNEEITYDYLPSAYKHSAFRHEEELRVYLGVALPAESQGFSIDVDLNRLIKKIVVSPNSKEWFKRNIMWIIEKAGYEFDVIESIFKNKLY